LRALSALLLVLLSAPAQAETAAQLPEPWILQDDTSYAPADKRWRYQRPADRAGFSAYGELDGLQIPEDIDAQAIERECRGKPESGVLFDVHKGTRYWYFQSGPEAIVLIQNRALVEVKDCRAITRDDPKVYRLLFTPDGYQKFTRDADGRYSAESHLFQEHWTQIDRRDIGIGSGFDPVTWLAMRKRRLSDSDRGGKLGKLKTHCIGFSSPPDGGGSQCWIAAPGPSQGLVTFDMQLLAGSPDVYQQLLMVENGRIDGRLFEWDRNIELAKGS
jgi:hypothetical protein